jgi:hypothetical protein
LVDCAFDDAVEKKENLSSSIVDTISQDLWTDKKLVTGLQLLRNLYQKSSNSYRFVPVRIVQMVLLHFRDVMVSDLYIAYHTCMGRASQSRRIRE